MVPRKYFVLRNISFFFHIFILERRPIYYPSASFHIGHCYTTIIADAIARYKRLDGYDVYFQTGTDEHGQKIENKAKEAGVSPKEYVDEIIADTKDLWNCLNIKYDYFVRTTDEDHMIRVQEIFKKLYDKGDIYKGEYSGLYCTPCESFWTESQLVDGKCPDCGRDVHMVKEEAYFFKLSKYADSLLDYYEKNPNFLLPLSRKNEMINNFIKPGLQDLCVSRTSFKWGIPVTFDPDHVIYVWIDALSNYITTLGYPDEESEMFKKFWPCDLHIVGKEIVRFHAIIWPCILMALGLPLPKRVFAHGWLLVEGNKISKSFGNYKDPRVYINEFGVDAIRYYALREVPFGSDGNFSEDALLSRYNSDLANTLGNLVNRSIAMANKYFEGKVSDKNSYEEDNDFINLVKSLKEKVAIKMNDYDAGAALECIFEVLRRSNKYVDETTPWILYKEGNFDRLEKVIYNLLESVRICTILLQPFIPDTCERIFNQLGISNTTFEDINKKISFAVREQEVLFERK